MQALQRASLPVWGPNTTPEVSISGMYGRRSHRVAHSRRLWARLVSIKARTQVFKGVAATRRAC